MPVTVTLERVGPDLVIDIVNGPGRRGVGGGSGRGITGMLERVELYSGALTVGPTDAGGWRVRAHSRSSRTASPPE